jgi:hypothetical protein
MWQCRIQHCHINADKISICDNWLIPIKPWVWSRYARNNNINHFKLFKPGSARINSSPPSQAAIKGPGALEEGAQGAYPHVLRGRGELSLFSCTHIRNPKKISTLKLLKLKFSGIYITGLFIPILEHIHKLFNGLEKVCVEAFADFFLRLN